MIPTCSLRFKKGSSDLKGGGEVRMFSVCVCCRDVFMFCERCACGERGNERMHGAVCVCRRVFDRALEGTG